MAQKQVRSTPSSARVYRRRRLAVLIALLVAIGLLVWAGFDVFLDNVLGPEDDITLFEYTKRSNREQGPALVGIELGDPTTLDALIFAGF